MKKVVEDTLHLLQLQVKTDVENALHQNRPTLNVVALTHLRCCLRGKGPPVLQVQAPKVMGP